MNWKVLSKISLTLSLVTLVGVQSSYGIDTDTKEKLRLKAINTLKYALPSDGQAKSGFGAADRTVGQYIGATSSSANLGCTPGLEDAVRGLTVGCTFYDYQRNGSMNRIIATNEPTHFLNFTWMNQNNNSATGGRNVKYEGYDPFLGKITDGSGGTDIGGGILPPDRSGYTSIDSRGSDGLVVNAHHWDPNFSPPGTFNSWVFYNSTPSLADFAGQKIDTSITNPLLLGNANSILWPRVAYTNDGAGFEVTHLIIHSDRTDQDGEDYYLRKVGSGVNGTWSTPIVIGAGGYNLSPSMTASRKAGSQKVVIAASFGRGDGTKFGGVILHGNGLISGQIDNDLYYMESTDAGATWGPLTNVTMRPDSLAHDGDPVFQFAVGAKLDVLYDQNDVFHIVWQAPVWNGYGGPFPLQGRFFHYDPVNDKIRIVHDFVWDQTQCNGGVFNLNATNPQISECDNKLYVTFTQFNDIPAGLEDDCSTNAPTAPVGAANGDIYVSVSDNGGLNWDAKRNLTDTYTPDCDTLPGGLKPDCDSDMWHSATRYGIDVDVSGTDDFGPVADLSGNIGGYIGPNYIFVQYVNDSDPGGAIRPEGSWTNSGIKVFRFGCVEKVSAPLLASSIPQGQAVDDPAFTPPGTDSVLVWVLTNVGNAPANYSIAITNDDPVGNVSLTGSPSGTISEGDPNFLNFALTLNANLETTVQHAHADIQVTGNFANSPINLAIDYTIGDIQLRKTDTLANCLVFANSGGAALQNNGGVGGLTMDFQNVPASLECDTTGNADNYLFDASPVISYNGGQVVSSMFSTSIVDSFQFRPLTPPSTDDVSNPDWFIGNSGEFTTQDSTLGFTVDWFSPKSTIFSNPDWKIVYGRVGYYNVSSTPIDSVFCAYAWDWDVPSDSGSRNTSNIDIGRFLLSMQGAEFGEDTGNTACQPNDQRWAATIFVPTDTTYLRDYSDVDSGIVGVGFQSLYTRDNASYVGGDWDHPKLDTALHTLGGFSKFSSTASDSQEVDLHMVLNSGAYRIDPNDSLYLWFIMITGIGDQAAFDACADTALSRPLAPPAIPEWYKCCFTAGDFNHDGAFNISDVTAGIARVFSGGNAPQCLDEADYNNDGTFNITDVTKGIARIFSGGGAPVCDLNAGAL